MKIFGSISRLVSILFRKDSQDVTLRPNQSTTYTAARDVQLPPGDASHVLVSADSTQTFTNKSIDADTNTITNIENADIKASAGIVESKLALDYSTSSLNTAVTNAQTDIDDLVTLSGVAANATNLGTFTGTTIPDSSTVKAALQSLETSLESLPDPMEYKGNWAASTNTPSLADGVGNNGDVYYVTDAGSVDFGSGAISFAAGDRVVYSGTDSVWQKWDTTDQVTSVAGKTGAVTLDTDDVSEATNLYFTDERAQDAVGGILTDSASIDFTYNDAGNQITAAVLPAGVDHDSLANFVANEHIDHSSVSIATSGTSGLSGGGDITSTRNLSVSPTSASAATIAASDTILFADASNSDALAKSTVQGILDLIPASANSSFTWTDGSATFAPSHNLGSLAVLVEIYDENGQTVYIDSAIRDTTNTLALTRSEATVGGNWTVLVRK